MFNVFGVVKVLAYLGIVIIIAGGLWYVMNLKAELATSEANNKILENSISQQSAVIEQMKVDIAQIQRINEEVNAELGRQREEVKNLVNRFNVNARGESRDIGKIAVKKPRAMQRLINRGTKNALRCLEIATGAERTEKEINAKKESEINRECPTLANPNYIPVFN
jgi:multidrug resistance efflux pump|tara:strand:+ start:479 stop:976 length:498 start_codon:yes stop_codon:yes gene_type:complete